MSSENSIFHSTLHPLYRSLTNTIECLRTRFILLRMRTKISATLGWLIHCTVTTHSLTARAPWILPTHSLSEREWSLTHSLTQHTHSLTHSLTHPLTHSLTQSNVLHSLTHSLILLILQAIGHYTLASSYLSSGNMIATSLHLRMALHLQPNFGHAHSALKLVMCSLKFKEEQRQLEHKVTAVRHSK